MLIFKDCITQFKFDFFLGFKHVKCCICGSHFENRTINIRSIDITLVGGAKSFPKSFDSHSHKRLSLSSKIQGKNLKGLVPAPNKECQK